VAGSASIKERAMISRRIVAGGLAGVAALAPTARATAMSVYRWKKRPLVVFASDEAAPALASQRAAVAGDRGGFTERDMVVVWVIGDQVTADFGAGPGLDAKALRARYGIATTAFRSLLIGKDGGVKLSSAEPLTAKRLFVEIDSMPMRRQEMRNR
jgi:Domain of unknown function (DUF4174)